MNRKDPNYAAKIENAIADKYGEETIQNPKANWSPEKEKEYLDQLKKVAKKENQRKDKTEKVDVEGILINRKLINKKNEQRSCPVCKKYSFDVKDETYKIKWGCCFNCFIKWVEGREERWNDGWRPE